MEAHLLRTNDWMITHDFPEDQKVRRFCLTLWGEAKLWCETLNAQQQQLNWAGLQEKLGNSTPNLVTLENSISMHGDLFILVRQPTL